MKRRILAAVMALGCADSLWFGAGTNGHAMTDRSGRIGSGLKKYSGTGRTGSSGHEYQYQ